MKNLYHSIKKQNSGITLISLVVTIIILIILATVGATSGISAINGAKITKFTTQMKLMQLEINDLYDKYSNGKTIEMKDGTKYTGDEIANIGKELTQANQEKIDNIFKPVTENGSGIEDKTGYRYFDEQTIENLQIDEIEQEFLVNIKTRTVINYDGLKYEEKIFYTLDQLPDTLYNVEYENPNTGKPTFDVDYETLSNGNWKVKINNVKYEEGQNGFITKWKVKYQKANTENKDKWYISDDLEFIVNTAGKYKMFLFQQEIQSNVVEVEIYSEDISGANHPELEDGMQAITYAEDGTPQPVKDATKKDWYSYIENLDENMQDGGTTNGGNSRWANAMLNGNYYVWIPRYAYKIDNTVTYNSQSGNSHQIDIEFIGTNVTNNNVITEVGSDYIVHPAFTFGGKELAGIWVGKYETSGNTTTPTIIPNKISLKDINVSTMFNTSRKLSTTNYDSHMMKNTEWGVVAYLAQSKYGRNGTEISVNQCSNYITGAGKTEGENKIYESTGYNKTVEQIIGTAQAYNGEIGKLSSTTGNIYGIYDMSGGTNEYVMGIFGENGKPSISASGFTEETLPEPQYYDLYTKSNVDESNIGDALYETKSWNSDHTNFVDKQVAYFQRGGYCFDTYGSGIFNVSNNYGNSGSGAGLRIVIIKK